MEKRIKIIYILTSVALALLLIMQALWLYTQYKLSIEQYTEETTEIICDIVENERKHRDNLRNRDSSNVGYKFISISDEIGLNGETVKIFNINLGDTTFIFETSDNVSPALLMDAPAKFILDYNFPVQVTTIDSMLASQSIIATSSRSIKDSMIWEHNSQVNGSTLTVEVPYDNLQGEVLVVEAKIQLSQAIVRMGSLLILSVIVSLFVIFSFILQIKTIRQQSKVNEIRQDFLHTMIHELKRPISTLKVCASSLNNEKMMLDAEFKNEVLQTCFNELDNLSAYFSKLRDVAMADSGAIPLNISQVHFPELIEDLKAKISIPNAKDVSFELMNNSPISIEADGLHLQNIFHNLIENAIKYSDKVVHIPINYYVKERYLYAEVSDNGFGISSSDLPNIFDKFYRTRDYKSITGMGLGLSYVKMLIEAHKGSISVESRIGEGSKFIIKLPVEQ